MKPTQQKSDIWPNVNQGPSFLGIRVRDGNRGLQITRRKGTIPLAEKFVRIDVSYPACVAFAPEGAENKKSATGTP